MGFLKIIEGDLLYLDVNIWIYALEEHPTFFDVLKELLQKVDQKALTLVTSELSLSEALVKPIKEQDIPRQMTYRRFLSSRSGVRIIPVHRTILIEAARQRALTNRLKLPDAIHFATALVTNCTIFLTNDKQFKSSPTLPVLILSEMIF